MCYDVINIINEKIKCISVGLGSPFYGVLSKAEKIQYIDNILDQLSLFSNMSQTELSKKYFFSNNDPDLASLMRVIIILKQNLPFIKNNYFIINRLIQIADNKGRLPQFPDPILRIHQEINEIQITTKLRLERENAARRNAVIENPNEEGIPFRQRCFPPASFFAFKI
jgi:hypothetical protein